MLNHIISIPQSTLYKNRAVGSDVEGVHLEKINYILSKNYILQVSQQLFGYMASYAFVCLCLTSKCHNAYIDFKYV